MPMLTEYTSFADAQTHCSKEGLWELFDGDRAAINIAHECIERHPRDRVAVRIALAAGGSESYTYGEISDWSGRYANFLHGQCRHACATIALARQRWRNYDLHVEARVG